MSKHIYCLVFTTFDKDAEPKVLFVSPNKKELTNIIRERYSGCYISWKEEDQKDGVPFYTHELLTRVVDLGVRLVKVYDLGINKGDNRAILLNCGKSSIMKIELKVGIEKVHLDYNFSKNSAIYPSIYLLKVPNDVPLSQVTSSLVFR